MKRRKKLWIACVAVVVVALVCAFALIYRMPYRFLNGARIEEVTIGCGSMQLMARDYPLMNRDYTTTRYTVPKPYEVMIDEAEEELEVAGWESPRGGLNMDPSYWHPERNELLRIRPVSVNTELAAPYTTVIIERPTTLTDRILIWIHIR